MTQMQPPDQTTSMTVRAAQDAVDESIRALGGYWPPLANLARLFEECGELARAVNQGFGPKLVKPGEARADLAEELGDVLYVALALANSVGVDAQVALANAIARAQHRIASPPAAPSNEHM